VRLSDTPLVSIVTPVLNRVDSIHACLASVASQAYPAIEHIVVDGGSTDGTLAVVEAFKRRNDLRLISEPDGGMYEAINKGLTLVRGDVVAYLNSDDFYLPWSVDVAVAALKQRADIVFGDLGILRLADDESTFFLQFYPPFDLTYYTHVGTLGQPTVFWRREISDSIGGFDTAYRLIGDCEYWLRAATRGAAFVHVDEVLAIQTDHGQTLRATLPQDLQAEFRSLRASYSSVVPPPQHPWIEARRRSVRWRLLQLRFLIEMSRRTPARWPHFVQFLEEGDLGLTRPMRVIASMLPARVRPSHLMRVDAAHFERRFHELIGAATAAR
jgi:glycosyltransferase involved in cell wall biosynthesis